ncbi:hypothetical protein ABPG72_005196 [Tetrahymena utriculariae]
MNNNNVFLQNLVDPFKVLNSTTQTLFSNLTFQQMNISDQICSYMSQTTLPNQGGVQLQGNLISLGIQQITSKNLKQVLFNYKDSNITSTYYLGQTTCSRNPFEQTPKFQNYTQQLKQLNSIITIIQNPAIKYSLDLVNSSSNRLIYQQGSDFEGISSLHNNRQLSNDEETQNNTKQKAFIFKFENIQKSSNNQTCLQKQKQKWSSDECSNLIENNNYYCNCKSTNITTMTDDLKSLLINKMQKQLLVQMESIEKVTLRSFMITRFQFLQHFYNSVYILMEKILINNLANLLYHRS